MSDRIELGPRPSAVQEIDLSAQIIEAIERRVGERVTCRWIGGTKYRCNWWAPKLTDAYDNPKMNGLTVTTHVVAKSRFISVVRGEKQLVISDATPPPVDR